MHVQDRLCRPHFSERSRAGSEHADLAQLFSACKITGNTKIGEIITTCFEVISKATPLSRRCVLITIVF